MSQERIFDILNKAQENSGNQNAFGEKIGAEWHLVSCENFRSRIDVLSSALLKYGLSGGSKVGIVSNSRVEWNIVDFALQQIGAVSVPIYPTITIEDMAYIFADAELEMIFVSDEELFDKVNKARNKQLQVISFDRIEGIQTLDELIDKGELHQGLTDAKRSVKPDDLVTIIYTSGTTGKPKGVMLSHANIMSNVKVCAPLLPLVDGDKALSFLPLCHVFERMLIYLYLYSKVTIYYAESLEKIGDNLKEIKPEFFTCVPRLLEKVYDKIYAKGKELTGVKRKLFFWAMKVGFQYDHKKLNAFGYNIKLSIARKLIFSKWKEALGGNIKGIVSGSAPLQTRLATIFWAAGLPIMEGYGLTETSPVISVNHCDLIRNRIGTVGPLLENVEVKIAKDGEILVKGPNVMLGYYKNQEATDQVIVDGWFYTGDIGEIDEDGFLKITDRKKNQFKTSGGKYIYPSIMENKIKESIYIEQIMITGEAKRFPGALVVPNRDNVEKFCRERNIDMGNKTLSKVEEVVRLIDSEIEIYNQDFAKYAKVKQFRILDEEWTIERGELTPTLKNKRKVIRDNYAKLIEDMYAYEGKINA